MSAMYIFRLDNTEGYSQEQLDYHNNKFEKIYGKEFSIAIDNDNYHLQKSYKEKYFTEFMC